MRTRFAALLLSHLGYTPRRLHPYTRSIFHTVKSFKSAPPPPLFIVQLFTGYFTTLSLTDCTAFNLRRFMNNYLKGLGRKR
jgi:hypothetical protein